MELTENCFRGTISVEKCIAAKRQLEDKMNLNDSIYGFTITSVTEIPEAGGTLYLMRHDKSSARLAFLDRTDDNKTFAVSFNTPPEDDTGVFHIIEHSTLCGSKKFPVKEPFVELLKGSLNTFLNAMTYEDRTVYPVSSRCDKDFYNLTEVYLDAVFYPLMKENPFIFMQEGWHYEYDKENDTLSYNGVVYNEMKGAYSSADEIGYSKICRMLYEGSSYGKDSGGDPAFIPDLTYEKFKEQHDRYYHPSSARIYLDGSVDLSSILPLIDSYLSAFPKSEAKELPVLVPSDLNKREEIEFEISEDEAEEGKARLLLGYSFSDFSSQEDRIMATVVTAHLAASNESPLPKALLDAGLAEDVIVGVNHSAKFTLTVEIKGIDPKNEKRILEIYNSVIEKEISGMDRDSLISNLNQIEFKLRERDLGGFPIGVANALSVYEVWTYGGDPAEGLFYENVLKNTREGILSGKAEELLCRMVKNNPYKATLLMLPSKTVSKRRDEKIEATLKKYRESLSEESLSKIIKAEEDLRAWQNSEDTAEALASLPSLSIADVTLSDFSVDTKEKEYLGAKIISHTTATRGISYVNIFFDGSDLTEDEVPLLGVLSSVLTNLPTEGFSALELKKEIKRELGTLAFSSSALSNSKTGLTAPLLRISASLLNGKRGDLIRILSEIISKTVFTNSDAVKKLLVQTELYIEELFTSNGEAAAIGRLEAMGSSHGKLSELLHGYESYLAIKRYIKEIDENPERFMATLEMLIKRIAVRERATVSVNSDDENSFAEDIIGSLPSGTAVAERVEYGKNPVSKEAISIPSRVSFAAAGLLIPESKKMLGCLRVIRSILSYEFLWNEIRVKGGAYGAGFSPRRDGGLYFYSYRDPSPENSLLCFKTSANYLRALAKSDSDLTKFIIGAAGEYDVLRTPKTSGAQATANILSGWSEDDEISFRESLLSTDKESLLLAADLLDGLFTKSGIAVAASADTLNSFKEKFDVTLKI